MVHMLGGFEMYYDGMPVRFHKKLTSKPLMLLQLLLYNRENGVSRHAVIEALYGQETTIDTNNNLNATVSQLRRILRETHLPQENYIHAWMDRYYFESSFSVRVDTEEVKALCHEAELETGSSRLEILYRICALYHGRFLPELSSEIWAEIADADCQRLYRESLNEILCILQGRGDYGEILRLSNIASKKFPFDEWQVWQQEALLCQGRIKEAHELYRQVEKLYRDELDAPPPERMRARFRSPAKELWRNTAKPVAVRKWLSDAVQTGPCVIPLPSFPYVYDLITKQSRITDLPFCLLLFTMHNSDGRTHPAPRAFHGAMEKLESILKDSLRREDVFTRYTRNQFLALLPGASAENSKEITATVEANFQKWAGQRKLQLDCQLLQPGQLQLPEKQSGA